MKEKKSIQNMVTSHKLNIIVSRPNSTVIGQMWQLPLTGSAVITHDVTTGTGYCLVGFNWIIDFLISQSDTALHKF